MTATRTYRPHAQLAERLLEYRGAIVRGQAIELFGEHALEACVAEGSVARILPGVYVHSSLAKDPEVRVLAASRWCEPHGALSGAAAAWVWGLLRTPPERVTVQLPPPLHLERPRWIRVIRPETPLPIETHGRYRVVPRPNAVVQQWSEETPRQRVGRLVDAVHWGKLSAESIAAAAELRPRLTARTHLHRVLGELDGGVTSFLEHHARTRVFPRNMYPWLTWQVGVVALGRDRTIDAVDPQAMLALEFDGRATHSSEEDRLADIERDAALATLGYTPLHFTYEDLMYRTAWCRTVYEAARSVRVSA